MQLIMSDIQLTLPRVDNKVYKYINLLDFKIHNCVGCYGCWTKTPGKCVIRDDATKIYPLIAKSERLLYVTRVVYGCYDVPMKTMLERALPIQQAFIHLVNGEAHHVQRDVKQKRTTIIAYGELSQAEKVIFQQLVERNAHNMHFASVEVIFVEEEHIEVAVSKELAKWEMF